MNSRSGPGQVCLSRTCAGEEISETGRLKSGDDQPAEQAQRGADDRTCRHGNGRQAAPEQRQSDWNDRRANHDAHEQVDPAKTHLCTTQHTQIGVSRVSAADFCWNIPDLYLSNVVRGNYIRQSQFDFPGSVLWTGVGGVCQYHSASDSLKAPVTWTTLYMMISSGC